MRVIGITDTFHEDKFDQYVRWISAVEPEVEIRRLSYTNGNSPTLDGLHGVVLSGGGDVHPRFYDREDLLPAVRGVDEHRDEFEFDVISRALDLDLPVLGVCRGMQVMNVALGGSLVADLATDGFKDHTSRAPETTVHPVSIVPHSLIHVLAGIDLIDVNSFHHQAADRMGKGLIRTAISTDGVTEAAEWALKDGMPFLLLVQWHPERQSESTVSQHIAQVFLREVHRYSEHQHHH